VCEQKFAENAGYTSKSKGIFRMVFDWQSVVLPLADLWGKEEVGLAGRCFTALIDIGVLQCENIIRADETCF
jgi:hypothetical protein